MRARDLIPTDVHCVFAAGSLIRGWGNASSDLDLYVVSEHLWRGAHTETAEVALDPGCIRVNSFYVGERRWDIDYWTNDQVRQAISKVSWSRYNAGPRSGRALSRNEIDLVERLGHAVPLVGTEWLERHREELRGSAIHLVAAEDRLNFSEIFIEDAAGQLAESDLYSAVMSARQAFAHAVDALTAYHGEFGHSAKWRPRRIMAVRQESLSFEEYWRIETMRDLNPKHPAPWVEEVLAVCRHISHTLLV